MDRVLVFIFGLPLAVAIVYYRRQIGDFIGPVDFAERMFSGGTYTLVLLIALLVFAGSIMYAFGTLQTLLGGTVGPLFGR